MNWFDLYLLASSGGISSVNSYSTTPNKNHRFNYGIFSGVRFYPSKRIGCFAEYGFSNHMKWKAGICIKLKN
jgi:hypothetical protein